MLCARVNSFKSRGASGGKLEMVSTRTWKLKEHRHRGGGKQLRERRVEGGSRCSRIGGRPMKEETAMARSGFLERGPEEEMERRGGQREAEEGGVTVGGDCRPTEPLFQRAGRPAKKLMK